MAIVLAACMLFQGCCAFADSGKADHHRLRHQQHHNMPQQPQDQPNSHQPLDNGNAAEAPMDGHAPAADGFADEAIEEVGEDAAAQEAGMQDQLNSDVVPYAQPAGDVGMLANGGLENQMSAEISALMKAALQSGRQIDVELPSGAVMRIR